ncbi:chromosome condensation complex Condensin, subunit G [Saitoella coloradoensis]
MPGRRNRQSLIESDPVTSLKPTLASIFNDAQRTTATHRKLVNATRSLQDACVEREGEDGEEAFTTEFLKCLNKVLPVKKSEPTADRVVKFCVAFIQHIQETGVENQDEDVMDMSEADIETTGMRFADAVMRHLLRGLEAKDKVVRLRCCQVITLAINSLSAIDDDVFEGLRTGLMRRARDKESSVRVQAVVALSRLQGEDDEEGREVVKALKLLLQTDPSAEVRRAVLFNIEQNKGTLPYILERARDQDPINRRCVYSRSMRELGDFRLLRIKDRERILKWGLKDRDLNVRKAAAKMFSSEWIEQANNNLLELLERLDVVNSQVAEDAMQAFFTARPDVVDAIEFNDDFWLNLTAESAFLARTFIDFCHFTEVSSKMEDKLPEVTRLAFYIQRYVNALGEAEELQKPELEFVVEQLLMIALSVDFADEVGRRTMYRLLRDILVIPELPEVITAKVIQVVRKVTDREVDFSQTIIEVISDLHDTVADKEGDGAGDDSFHSAQSDVDGQSPQPQRSRPVLSEEEEEAKLIRQSMINMKCLHIAQCMLENVEGRLQNNTHLVNILNGLIVPSVRSREAPIRESGLHCLGLCSLLDDALAKENLGLFVHCFQKGHEALQIKALSIICDIIMSHGLSVLDDMGVDVLNETLLTALQWSESPEVQAAAVEGVAKLMLSNIVTDPNILKILVVLYFDPSSSENQRLRQCLTYFLPVYCHSLGDNQVRMQQVAFSALHHLCSVYDDLEEGENMVSPMMIAQQLLDWTDPTKLVKVTMQEGQEILPDADVQANMARDALYQIREADKEERKVLCSMLGKLYINERTAAPLLLELQELASDIVEEKVVTDTLAKNALVKFTASLDKLVSTIPQDKLQYDIQAEESSVETAGEEEEGPAPEVPEDSVQDESVMMEDDEEEEL